MARPGRQGTADSAPLSHDFIEDHTPTDLEDLEHRYRSRQVEVDGKVYRSWSANDVVDREIGSYRGPAGSKPKATLDRDPSLDRRHKDGRFSRLVRNSGIVIEGGG